MNLNKRVFYLDEPFIDDIEFGLGCFGVVEYFERVVIEEVGNFFDCIKGEAELWLLDIDIENIVFGDIEYALEIGLEDDASLYFLSSTWFNYGLR